MTTGNQNQREIEQWMGDVAKQQRPKTKLIFDKQQKKLVAVGPNDPRYADPDKALPFTAEEAKRFVC